MSKTVNEKVKNQFLNKFGVHIKTLRTEKGLTQEELAKRCNSNTKKIYRTEKGEYDFKFSSLIVLAKGLDTSIPELLNFDYPEDIFENFWTEKLPILIENT
jgi:transcriptional regulator with XRE-family HTH domain